MLLLLHVALIVQLLGLRATRERPGETLLTLALLHASLRKLDPPTPTTPRAARQPRRSVAVPVPVDPPERSFHDSVTPVDAPLPGPAAPPAAALPLNLAIPKEFFTHPTPLTVGQQAMLDPRSNRLVLTKQEQLDVDFGAFECIAWQRQPDGSIYRGPGHYQRIQGIGTNPFTAHTPGREDRGSECVK